MRLRLTFLTCTTVLFVFVSSFGQETRVSPKEDIETQFLKLKELLKSAKIDGDKNEIALKYYQLGVFCVSNGVYSEGVYQFNEALAVLERGIKNNLKVDVFLSLGKIYLQLKNLNQAESYFLKASALAKVNKYGSGTAKARSLLGSCFEKRGLYLKALTFQQESLDSYQRLNDSIGIAYVKNNIGSIYEDLEEFEKAQKYFFEAHKQLKDGESEVLINVLNNIGDIYRKTGKYKDGEVYTKESLRLGLKINNQFNVASAYKDLSKTYTFLGHHVKALAMLQKSNEVKESIVSEQNLSRMNALQTIYDTKQKEIQIKDLLQENRINKSQQKLLLVVLGAFVIIVGIAYLYFLIKRKEQQRIQEYKQRTLQVELEKKVVEEKKLQQEVQLKAAALSRYSLHLAQKNKILSDLSQTLSNMVNRKNIDLKAKLKGLIKEIDFDLAQEQEWKEFMTFFKDIHPEYEKKISAIAKEALSPAELRLGILLRLNLSSKEIASILRVTPDSVRVARYRLRKKLPIDAKVDLIKFLIKI